MDFVIANALYIRLALEAKNTLDFINEITI